MFYINTKASNFSVHDLYIVPSTLAAFVIYWKHPYAVEVVTILHCNPINGFEVNLPHQIFKQYSLDCQRWWRKADQRGFVTNWASLRWFAEKIKEETFNWTDLCSAWSLAGQRRLPPGPLLSQCPASPWLWRTRAATRIDLVHVVGATTFATTAALQDSLCRNAGYDGWEVATAATTTTKWRLF